MVPRETSRRTLARRSLLEALGAVAKRRGLRGMYTLALRGGAPLGNLATGLVASRWGIRRALLVNGVLAVTGHFLLIRRRRRRRARDGASAGPPSG